MLNERYGKVKHLWKSENSDSHIWNAYSVDYKYIENANDIILSLFSSYPAFIGSYSEADSIDNIQACCNEAEQNFKKDKNIDDEFSDLEDIKEHIASLINDNPYYDLCQDSAILDDDPTIRECFNREVIKIWETKKGKVYVRYHQKLAELRVAFNPNTCKEYLKRCQGITISIGIISLLIIAWLLNSVRKKRMLNLNEVYLRTLKKQVKVSHFMKPYDKEKVDVAADLSKKINRIDPNHDVEELEEIKAIAVNKLQLDIIEKYTYDQLKKMLNPQKWSNNGDPKIIHEVNELYAELGADFKDITYKQFDSVYTKACSILPA